VALKEWASVVLALERGLQDVILRRGGISEPGDVFEPEYAAFLLFPTFFHQQADGLRKEFRSLYDDARASEPSAGRLVITSRAKVRSTRALTSEAEVDALANRHVYRREVVLDRLHGVYGKALYVLEVDVERLAHPLDLPMVPEYAGCRSWVDLERTM
jgi:hypothetical protein